MGVGSGVCVCVYVCVCVRACVCACPRAFAGTCISDSRAMLQRKCSVSLGMCVCVYVCGGGGVRFLSMGISDTGSHSRMPRATNSGHTYVLVR